LAFFLHPSLSSFFLSFSVISKQRRKRREKAKEEMGLLSNKIDREVLKPGDHIYSWRNAYLYGHHGLSLYLSLFFAFSCCVIGVLDAHWDQFCKENDALACFLVSLFVFGILDQCGYPFGFRFVKQLMFWCAFRMPI
jgi:hypothetical protein